MPSVYFIIPAYNEERNLPLLMGNTKEAMSVIGLPYRIFIVNDGSTDKTGRLCERFAKDMPVQEIRFEKNKGVDQAFNEGFKEVFRLVRKDDIIVTKEADNTSDPDILVHMIEHIRNGYDIALASCFAKEGKVENSSLDRHILSFGANTLLKTFFPIPGVNTYSSFYRAFNGTALKAAFAAYKGRVIEEKGFVCIVEMLVKLARLPFKIIEVPMVLKCDMREGSSKMKRRKTIKGYLAFIGKQALRPRREDRAVYERFRNLIAQAVVADV